MLNIKMPIRYCTRCGDNSFYDSKCRTCGYKEPTWMDRHYRCIMLASMLLELLLLGYIAWRA